MRLRCGSEIEIELNLNVRAGRAECTRENRGGVERFGAKSQLDSDTDQS